MTEIYFKQVEREGRRIAEEKAKKGWFGGWFSSNKNDSESSDGADGDLGKWLNSDILNGYFAS